MTKEELEKEARNFASVYAHEYAIDDNFDSVYQASKEAYLAGAEPREKRIAELEAQIEKMKNCENCGKEFTKECAWWKRAEENRQINTCKDWEIKEK